MAEYAQQEEKCENCGAVLGGMEPAYLYRDQTLCAACYQQITGQLEISSAETVKMPSSQERIARPIPPLPIVLESYWRPNHPIYKLLQQQAVIRRRRAAAGITGGVLAFGGLITLAVGASQQNDVVLGIGIIVCSVGILTAVIAALWPNNPSMAPRRRP